MGKVFSKIFTSDVFLGITSLIAVLVLLFQIKNILGNEDVLSATIFIMTILSIIGLVISYFKHEKNVMKGLMGSLLAFLIVSDLIPFASNIKAFGTDKGFVPILLGIELLILILLSVIHFCINADHHSSPGLILFNQILAIAFILVNIAKLVYGFTGVANGLTVIASALKMICATLIIVSIESKLDAYRIIREENGWTDQSKK